MDIQPMLFTGFGFKGLFEVHVDGEKIHTNKDVTAESLAKEPQVLVVPWLGRIAIGWDPDEERFLVKLNFVPFAQLDKLLATSEICRQKSENTAERRIR